MNKDTLMDDHLKTTDKLVDAIMDAFEYGNWTPAQITDLAQKLWEDDDTRSLLNRPGETKNTVIGYKAPIFRVE